MRGPELKAARRRARLSQVELSQALGISQAYVSILERSSRAVPQRIARVLAALLEFRPTELPLSSAPVGKGDECNESLTRTLAQFGHPHFANRAEGRASQNPTGFLISALASLERAGADVITALPWILLEFEVDSEYLATTAIASGLQNRLGFLVSLARVIAQRELRFLHRHYELDSLEQRLDASRLAREDTFGGRELGEGMRAWLRENRTDAARHWNLLTDLAPQDVNYDDPRRSFESEFDVSYR
jgi:transcriptional regulator with XRE-family HTH domain